jgi:hypothetical protein
MREENGIRFNVPSTFNSQTRFTPYFKAQPIVQIHDSNPPSSHHSGTSGGPALHGKVCGSSPATALARASRYFYFCGGSASQLFNPSKKSVLNAGESA